MQNLVIAFFVHIHVSLYIYVFFVHICIFYTYICFVMKARACFWAFLPMLPSSVIHLSSGGLIGGWYRGVEMVRDGLYYGM